MLNQASVSGVAGSLETSARDDSARNDMDQGSPRILLFSQRNLYEREVWRCSFNEFEGILQDIDAVDVVAPGPKSWYREGKRVALKLGENLRIPLNPGVEKVTLNRDYDVFLSIIEKPSELLHLKSLPWKDHCRTSICWVVEFYTKEIPIYKSCMEILAKFDQVIFMAQAIEPFKKWLSGTTSYLPAGVDAIRFCPFPKPPKRCIDVLSIGRRSERTHAALLKAAETEGLFYTYDTIADLHAYELDEHRSLMINRAKRSRYFIANPGKIDIPEETGGQSEFGYRYFEGAAPGAILVGQRPKNNREFEKAFDWEDALIDVPFGSENITEVIHELNRQPERLMRARKNNIMQCLLRHDWVYRWESVLGAAGLQPLPALVRRKEKLRQLAALVDRETIEP